MSKKTNQKNDNALLECRADCKRLEEELSGKDRELSDFMENAAIGLQWIDAQGKVLWANKAELNLLGYSPDEYIGRSFGNFHADADSAGSLLQSIQKHTGLHNFQARLVCKDGSVKDVLISSNMFWKNSEFVHARFFTRDISERKLFEEQLLARKQQLEMLAKELEHKNKELQDLSQIKSNFVSIVSHELRTPLTVIISSAGNLLSGTFGKLSETQTKWINKINVHSNRLHEMITDILDLSKLESGKSDIRREATDMGRMLKSFTANMQVLAKEKELKLSCRIQRDIPPIAIDPGRIEQVLTNLTANAIKFTPKGGSIEISASKEEKVVRVTVSDTGPGIGPENHQVIFSRFKQIRRDNEEGGAIKGIGLGLAICKEIISQHHGRIWVESVPGKGASFIFQLPIETVETAAEPEDPERHILVVDDDMDTCDLLLSLLRQEGYNTVCCTSAAEAVKRAQERPYPFDLVFLDLMLPFSNGIEVMKELKHIAPKTPVVIVTAYPESEILLEAMELTPLTIISKPFNPKHIREVTERFLPKKAII